MIDINQIIEIDGTLKYTPIIALKRQDEKLNDYRQKHPEEIGNSELYIILNDGVFQSGILEKAESEQIVNCFCISDNLQMASKATIKERFEYEGIDVSDLVPDFEKELLVEIESELKPVAIGFRIID